MNPYDAGCLLTLRFKPEKPGDEVFAVYEEICNGPMNCESCGFSAAEHARRIQLLKTRGLSVNKEGLYFLDIRKEQ